MGNIHIRILLVLIFLAGSCVLPVFAQGGLTATPANITVAGTKMDSPTRTVILSAQEDVTDLRFYPLDLESSEGTIFPAELIQATRISSQMANGSVQSVHVLFELRDAPDSGSFTGEMWFSYAGGVTKVPVTVMVKAGWFWPLVLLILSVLVSYALFVYKSKLKRKDEIVVRIGIIENNIKKDENLKDDPIYYYDKEVTRENPFYRALKNGIETVRDKLDADLVEDAATFLQNTEKIWDTWSYNPSEWVYGLEKFSACNKDIGAREEMILATKKIPDGPVKASGKIPYLEEVRTELRKAFDTITGCEKPKEFTDAVIEQGARAKTYIDHYYRILALQRICDRCGEQPPECDLTALWTSYLDHPPKGPFDELVGDIAERKNVIEQRCPAPKIAFGAEVPPPPFRVPEEYLGPAGVSKSTSQAWLRLRIFAAGSFLVTLVILVTIGYSELYLAKPTFGSFADYATLALWGLLVGPFADKLGEKTGQTLFKLE
jgi:hypothetical protein